MALLDISLFYMIVKTVVRKFVGNNKRFQTDVYIFIARMVNIKERITILPQFTQNRKKKNVFIVIFK